MFNIKLTDSFLVPTVVLRDVALLSSSGFAIRTMFSLSNSVNISLPSIFY